MSGAYTFGHVFARLHPRYLWEESRGQLIDAFWGSQDLGEPNIDPFTGSVHPSQPTTGGKIVPDVHKRHPWDTSTDEGEGASYWWNFFGGANGGYEEVTNSHKVEAQRSPHGELAYRHFTHALYSINQLEPGKVGKTALNLDAGKRRLEVLSDAKGNETTETALGFNRYLLHRYRGTPTKIGRSPAESKFSNAEGLKQSYRTIRAGTYNLLSRTIPPWRTDITFMNTLLSVFFLSYTLYFQARGCALIYREKTDWWSFSAPPAPTHSSIEAHSASTRLFIIFLLKEAYPVTYYLFWLVACAVISTLSLCCMLLSILCLGPVLFFLDCAAGGSSSRSHNVQVLRRFTRALRRDPMKAFLHRSLAQQVHVWSLMGLNLSSLYRIKEHVLMLTCRRLSKPSIRDADNKLSSVSNVLFNLCLLVLAPDNNSSNIFISAIVSLVVLFYQMVCEKQRNTDLAEALRDLNENRLSKFELALLLCKMIDDVTLEENQFNFVEHFYSSPAADRRYRLDHVPCEDYLPGDPPGLRLSARMSEAEAAEEDGHGRAAPSDTWDWLPGDEVV